MSHAKNSRARGHITKERKAYLERYARAPVCYVFKRSRLKKRRNRIFGMWR